MAKEWLSPDVVCANGKRFFGLRCCPGHEEVKEPLALCLGRDFAKSDPAFRRGNACVEAHLGCSIAWRIFMLLLAQAGPALRGVLHRQEK